MYASETQQQTQRIDSILTRFTWRCFLARNLNNSPTVFTEGHQTYIDLQLEITPQWKDDYETIVAVATGNSIERPLWSTTMSQTHEEYHRDCAIRLGAVSEDDIALVLMVIKKLTALIKETYFYKDPTGIYLQWFDEYMHTEITTCAGRFMAAFHRCRRGLGIKTAELLDFLKSQIACIDYTIENNSFIIVVNDGYITYSPAPLKPSEEQQVKQRCITLHETFRPTHLNRLRIGANKKDRVEYLSVRPQLTP